MQIKEIKGIKYSYYLMQEVGYCWQDWMLEDEVVTEEKQEVQLNKNSMETKEMTKEEVFEYLNDTKMLCTSTEESKKVQEKLFELGFSFYGENSKEVVDCAFILYINTHKKMQYGSDLSVWVEDDARRVEPNEILAIKIKEEKLKFDPKKLQPFDKVLVRDDSTDEWTARFFDIYKDGLYYTGGEYWVFCVPYNEDTKYLHGTTNDEPEFYQVWK